jgi:hypothetical protein
MREFAGKMFRPTSQGYFFLEPSLSRVTSTYHKSLSYAKLHKKCHVPEVSPMFCAILKRKKCTRMSPGTTKMKICRENDPPQRPRLGLVMFCQSHCNRESHQQHTTKKNKIILYQNVHQKSEGNKSFSYVFRDPAESETSGTSHKQNHYPRILS